MARGSNASEILYGQHQRNAPASVYFTELRLPLEKDIRNPLLHWILLNAVQTQAQEHPSDMNLNVVAASLYVKVPDLPTGKLHTFDQVEDAWMIFKERTQAELTIQLNTDEWDAAMWSLEQQINKAEVGYDNEAKLWAQRQKKVYQELSEDTFDQRQGKICCHYCGRAVPYLETVPNYVEAIVNEPANIDLPLINGRRQEGGWCCRECLRKD